MWYNPSSSVIDQCLPKEICYNRNERKSNLPFQIALYINLWLFPAWFIITVINLDTKYERLTSIYKVLTVAVFLILLVSEGLKLYLGYLGNLAGKIPELAGCWLILAFVELPLEMFLLFDCGTLLRNNEAFVHYFMICLLLLQIITGLYTLKKLSNTRAKMFYILQLCNKHAR